jgi:membrane-bound metal-dependent hydrolase YbcI (DUF457 family)
MRGAAGRASLGRAGRNEFGQSRAGIFVNTIPTHWVINAALEKKFGKTAGIARSAFLWGSVTPDIPLILLSLGFIFYNRYIDPQPVSGMMNSTYDHLYFNNPWWVASYNLLHSPTALLIYAALLWRFIAQPSRARGHRWLWFVLGCLVHSVIDILTHHNDGPLLFWPFDWQARFIGPISYWDRSHYAGQFFFVELGINIWLFGYLCLPNLIQRVKLRKSG